MSALKVFNRMRRMVRASPSQTEKDTYNWPRRRSISHLVLVIDPKGDIKSTCSHRW